MYVAGVSTSVVCVRRRVKDLGCLVLVFFLMIRRPPRSTLDRSSAASDVYKRQGVHGQRGDDGESIQRFLRAAAAQLECTGESHPSGLSLIHISEPTRPY